MGCGDVLNRVPCGFARVDLPRTHRDPSTNVGTSETVAPLRHRMIKDVTIRWFTPKIHVTTSRGPRAFVSAPRRSLNMGKLRGVHRYQLHLAASGVGYYKQIGYKHQTINLAACRTTACRPLHLKLPGQRPGGFFIGVACDAIDRITSNAAHRRQ